MSSNEEATRALWWLVEQAVNAYWYSKPELWVDYVHDYTVVDA